MSLEELQRSHQIVNQVMRISHAAKLLGCVVFKTEQLHPRQLQVLFFLAQTKQPVCGSSLVEKLKITPGAVTQLIASLVEKKLVDRVNLSDDRRQVHFVLTEAAKTKLAILKQKQHAQLIKLFQDFSEAELETLLSLLTRVGITTEPKGL